MFESKILKLARIIRAAIKKERMINVVLIVSRYWVVSKNISEDKGIKIMAISVKKRREKIVVGQRSGEEGMERMSRSDISGAVRLNIC